MNLLSLLPVFLTGLLGSVHCIGMCGGIVSAFSTASPRRPAFALVSATPSVATRLVPVLAYNFGRIGSYAAAGALAGGLAGAAATLTHLAVLQNVFYWLANLMLVALGLYLMDAWHGLVRLEAAGQHVWQKLRPLMRPLLPMDTPFKALALGAIWGWLPCAMVYSVLLTALLSGSAARGAGVMLAFGLGTLPTLLSLGMLGAQLRLAAKRRPVRVACGLLVLGFGVLGLMRASHGISLGWLDALCLSPQVLR